eukprot:SAG11_NODE_33516_length_277_cov_0.561798_1_plen_61_part_01
MRIAANTVILYQLWNAVAGDLTRRTYRRRRRRKAPFVNMAYLRFHSTPGIGDSLSWGKLFR